MGKTSKWIFNFLANGIGGYLLLSILVFATTFLYQKGVDFINYTTPPDHIWTYKYIRPYGTTKIQTGSFYVGEPMWFETWRYSNGTYNISMKEVLRCSMGMQYIDTVEVEQFPFKEGTMSGSIYRFGAEESFTPKEDGENCSIESCQYLDYYGHKKEQCFTSDLFDILPERK